MHDLADLIRPIVERYAGKSQMAFVWNEEDHPRETKAHDGKQPGQFAPKATAKTATEAARQGAARKRSNIGTFVNPIVGPSGASLLAYDWKWTWEPSEDGEDERKVSDWERAERNEVTGRDIVHHFHVKTPDGLQIVSVDSAIKLLGLSGEAGSRIKNLGTALMKLAQAKQELERLKHEGASDYKQKWQQGEIDRLEKHAQVLEAEAAKKAEGKNPVEEYRDLLRRTHDVADLMRTEPDGTKRSDSWGAVGQMVKLLRKNRSDLSDSQLESIKREGIRIFNSLNLAAGLNILGERTPKSPYADDHTFRNYAKAKDETIKASSDVQMRNWYKKNGEAAQKAIKDAEAWLEKYAPKAEKYAAICERYAGKHQMQFNWDEEAHPRAPKGTEGGGQFVKKEEGKPAASGFDDAHMTKLVRDGSLGMAQESIYDDFRNERIDEAEMDKRLAKLPKADAWNDAKKIAGHLGIHANGWSGKVKHYFGRIGEPEFRDGRLVNKISGPNGAIYVESGDIDLMGPKIQKALNTHRLDSKQLGPDILYFVDELAKEHLASDKNIRETLIKHGLSEKITESLPVRKLVVDRVGELREEAKKPSEARAKAMARFEELNKPEATKPKRELKPGYVEQPRAKAGGEVSGVDGKFYKGGALMPVHGAFSGQEKPPAKPKRADGEAMAVKADNEGKGVKAVRERSPEDVARMKEQAEEQRKWDKLKSGPVGEMYWMGDRPNGSAFRQSLPGHKNWAPLAEKLGKDGVAKLVDFMRDHAVGKQKPEERDPYREHQDFLIGWAQHFHTKKHLKAVPNTRDGEHWLGEYIDHSNLDEKLALHDKINELLGSKAKYSENLADLHLPYDAAPFVERYRAQCEKERYEWVESQHPRHEAGAPGGIGGQFAGSDRMGGSGGDTFGSKALAKIKQRDEAAGLIDTFVPKGNTFLSEYMPDGGLARLKQMQREAQQQSKVASMPGLAKSSKIRDVASPPNIPRDHDLHWSKAGEFSQKIFDWHLEMNRAMREMTLEHTAGADGEERAHKWEQAWQAGDKTKIRELLGQMNAMDKEARAKGIDLSAIVNANGLIPRELAERLSGGSRFFDPERIRDKIQAGNKKLGKDAIKADAQSKSEKVDSMLKYQPVPESAKIPGVMFTGQKSMVPKPMPAPRREESDPAPTPAEPPKHADIAAAVQSAFSQLPKQSQKKIDEAIRGLDDDMPSDMVADLRDTVMDTWKQLTQETGEYNSALREVMSQSGQNWGARISARLAKGVDYDKIKGFDQLAEYAATHYPNLLNQGSGESDSGSNEESLAKALQRGVREVPQPWSDEVMSRVRDQVQSALAASKRAPVEYDESVPFSIRDLVDKLRYAMAAA